MKIVLTVTTIAAVLFASTTSAQAQMAGIKSLDTAIGAKSGLVQKTGRRGRRRAAIGAGIAIGILGAAAAAQAHENREYRRERRWSRHERRCRRWRRWCHNGEREACWRYDNRC